MLRRLQDWLALTATERKVLLFVTGAFVAGLGIRLYQETFPQSPLFDYSASDSTFVARSAAKEQKAESPADDDGPLDLNKATKQQLMELPGIGPVTADRIIRYREEHGPFRTPDDLRKVRGISSRKLDQLKPFISVY